MEHLQSEEPFSSDLYFNINHVGTCGWQGNEGLYRRIRMGCDPTQVNNGMKIFSELAKSKSKLQMESACKRVIVLRYHLTM